MDQERSEISEHEIRFFNSLSKNWKSSKELADMAKISPRTSRGYALKFVRLGIVDLMEMFPRHRYRLADKASKRNPAYYARLEKVKAVLESIASEDPHAKTSV